MFSRAPDSAARSLFYSAIFWLAAGATALPLLYAKLVSSGFLNTRMLDYGRLTSISSITLQYGWLTLAGLAAIYYVVPRISGVPLTSEAGAQLSGMLINIVVLLGVVLTLFGGSLGPAFSELPSYLDAGLVLALIIAAAIVIRTVATRSEPRIYVSSYFFLGALIWAPLAIAVGSLHPYTGLPDWIAHLFSVNAMSWLWFSAIGIGATYYVLPRATRAPLWSHRLAVAGFWLMGFAAPFAGFARGVLGPAPDQLESVSIGASIFLLIPVLLLIVNVFGTVSSGTSSDPSTKFMVGGALVWSLAMLWGTAGSLRSVSAQFGSTAFVTGQVWFLILGAFTLWSIGVISFALPRLMGRNWVSNTRLSLAFWFTVAGAATLAATAIASGLISGTVWTIAGMEGVPADRFAVSLDLTSSMRAIGLAAAGAYAFAQWAFVLMVVKTTSSGTMRPVEAVLTAEAG